MFLVKTIIDIFIEILKSTDQCLIAGSALTFTIPIYTRRSNAVFRFRYWIRNSNKNAFTHVSNVKAESKTFLVTKKNISLVLACRVLLARFKSIDHRVNKPAAALISLNLQDYSSFSRSRGKNIKTPTSSIYFGYLGDRASFSF